MLLGNGWCFLEEEVFRSPFGVVPMCSSQGQSSLKEQNISIEGK